jgi:hypothetical protein
MGNARIGFLIILLMYSFMFCSCGGNNETEERLSTPYKEKLSTPYNERVLEVDNSTTDFAIVEEYLQKENIKVFEVSEINSHLIIRIEQPKGNKDVEGLAYHICSLVSNKGNSYSMVVLRDYGNNNISRAICDDGLFLAKKIIDSYQEEKYKVVEDFLREANITVYEVSEHNSYLIVRIDEPKGMSRPKGYAEIICGLVSGQGYSAVVLRDYDDNNIARSICK